MVGGSACPLFCNLPGLSSQCVNPEHQTLNIAVAAGGPPYIRDARLRRSPPALGASGAVSAIVIADVLLNPWRMVRCRPGVPSKPQPLVMA
jgi:membrane associated rhomboid family serine protease